jgi:hypothetical protein
MLIWYFSLQGYKVVGIDARPEPVELAKTLKYTPDLALLASETKAEEALEKIKKMTPDKAFEGIDGGPHIQPNQKKKDKLRHDGVSQLSSFWQTRRRVSIMRSNC